MQTETQEVIADNASDEAQWTSLQQEFGDDSVKPDEAPAEPQGEEAKPEGEPKPEAEAKQEQKKEEQKVPYEDLEQRFNDLKGAIGEERGKRRQSQEETQQLREQVSNMQAFLQQFTAQQKAAQQQQEEQYLTPEEIEARRFQDELQEVKKTNEELANWKQKTEQQTEAQKAQQQMVQSLVSAEQQFAAETPDYYDAAKHLAQNRMSELEAFYPDTPEIQAYAQQNGFQSVSQLREEILRKDTMQIAQAARTTGVNPAQTIYQLAKTRGYTGAQPSQAPVSQAAPAQQKPSQIESIRAGQQAAGSLSTGASSATDQGSFPSSAELADMYISDPERANKIWHQMSEAGAL